MSDTDHSTTHQAVSERLAWADKAEDAIRRVLDALGYHDAAKTKDQSSLVLSLLSWVGFLIAFKTDSHGIAASLWAGIAERVAPASPMMAGSASDAWIAARADAMVNAFVQRFPPVHAIRPSGEQVAADELHGLHIEAARVELASCLDKDPDATGLGELASECTAEIVRLRAEYRSAVDALRKTRETIDAASKALYCEPGILANYCVAVQQTLNGIALALTECETMPAYNNLETAVRHVVRLWRDAREQAHLTNEMFNGAKNAADVAVSQANRLRDEVRSALAAQNRAESERDAMRMVLDECTEQGDAARAVLAKVLDIEPDACSLPEMANRVAEALAMGQRARAIAAESEAARLRAELHTAQRELATMRENVSRKTDFVDPLDAARVDHVYHLPASASLQSLPKPKRIEPGQRWMLEVCEQKRHDQSFMVRFDGEESAWLATDVVLKGVYLGMAPSEEG